VELIALKSSIANVLQQKSNLEAKVKHLCFQMEDKETTYVELKMEMEIATGKFSAYKT
jgi:chaperonin cofactor prefoldin